MRKYWYRKCLIITLVFSVFFYTGYSVKEKMERNEKEEVSAGTVSDNTVIPGGMPIGIRRSHGSWNREGYRNRR